jgi:Heavy-metal resistance
MTDLPPHEPQNTSSTTPVSNWTRRLPRLKSPWWTALLGASLMANLLVGGLALGHRFGDGGGRGGYERMQGVNIVQLAPQSFFRGLPLERRRELLKVVRGKMRDLRMGGPNDAGLATRLAEALEKDNYVEADAKVAVDAFTTGTDSMASRSSVVALEFLAMLTPAERKTLALAIRDRVEKQERRKKN